MKREKIIQNSLNAAYNFSSFILQFYIEFSGMKHCVLNLFTLFPAVSMKYIRKTLLQRSPQ